MALSINMVICKLEVMVIGYFMFARNAKAKNGLISRGDMMRRLEPGDVLFTQAQPDKKAGAFISNQILWWNKTWWEAKTKCSHMGMISGFSKAFSPDNDDADLIYKAIAGTLAVEMTSGGQNEITLDKYLKGSTIYIYRNKMVDGDDADALTSAGLDDLGEPYGYSKILLLLLDAALGKLLSLPICLLGLIFGKRWRGIEIPIFSLLNVTGDYTCAQKIAKYYWQLLGICFGEHWRGMTPDRAMDHCESNSQWELVYSNEITTRSPNEGRYPTTRPVKYA